MFEGGETDTEGGSRAGTRYDSWTFGLVAELAGERHALTYGSGDSNSTSSALSRSILRHPLFLDLLGEACVSVFPSRVPSD